MIRRMIAVVALSVCSVVQAEIVAVDVSGLQGTYLLTVQGGNVTLSPITLVRPGPNPTPVPTPTPVPVPGDLTSTVKAATAAVPSYANKDLHRRAMGVSLTFFNPYIGGIPVAESRATIRAACNAAVGSADVAKWNAWWLAVDAKLDTMQLTPATYISALNDISAAVTSDLPPAAADDVNHGLPPEFWQMLWKMLLDFLTQLLAKHQ